MNTYKRNLSYLLGQIKALTEQITKLEENRAKMDTLDAALEKFADFKPEATSHNGFLDVYVDQMKQTVPILKALRKAGHKSTSFEDCPEQGYRLYKCDSGLWIRARLNRDASACRYVKVSEEIVTEKRPIYKLICGDAPANPAPEA